MVAEQQYYSLSLTPLIVGTIVTANDNMLRLVGNDDSWEACHKIDPKSN